jgi:hypothetical protein
VFAPAYSLICSTSKRAGVFLLLTGGEINANSEGIFVSVKQYLRKNFFVEVFEVACEIQQNIVMHPFAFRAHTHKLGKSILA